MKIDNLDFNTLTVFLAVVDSGSFTRAAERLGKSKQAVSHALQQLEAALQVPLLIRSTRRQRLTEAGQELYNQVSQGWSQIQQGLKAVQALHNTPRGRLRITAPHLLVETFLADTLLDFMRVYPDVHLDLLLSEQVENLISEDIDLALRLGPLEDSRLRQQRLAMAHSCCCASPAYLQEYGRPQRPEDLRQHRLLALQNRREVRNWHFESGTEQVSLSPAAVLRVNSSTLLLKALLQDHGIANLPTFLCAPSFASGHLQRVLPDWQTAATGIYAVYPRTEAMPAALMALLSSLRKVFQNFEVFDR